MKIKLLLSTSLFILLTIKGHAQENNCDVRQLQVNVYDFVLRNLDSIKKHTPKTDLITTALEFTEDGKVTNVRYYTAYAMNDQKEVNMWKGLDAFVKENFSRCPDSHFYKNREQVLKTVFLLPFVKENINKAKKEVEEEVDYIASGAGKMDVARDSKFTVDLKSFAVGKKTIEPIIKEGTMDYFRSKMVRLSDVFTIAFDIVKVGNTIYLKYTVYERVDNKSQTVTKEKWRPIVNSKTSLSVKGIRDTHPGVKHIKVGEDFDFDIDVIFSKQ